MNCCRRIVWLFLLSACVASCTYTPRVAQPARLYEVRAGDTLYSLAWKYGLDYQEVARWNGIEAPYTIYPGQRIRLNPPPGGWVPTETVTQAPERERPGPAETGSTTPAPPRPPVIAQPQTPARQTVAVGWIWPVEGEVIRRFAAGRGKQGIDIAGVPGTPVRAALPGKVVYSGSGLIGYGRLIIILHGDNYLSAYAHNRSLLVEEGQQVEAGQVIAELGSSGASRPMLHFEIRRDGTPVDPLRYLPAR